MAETDPGADGRAFWVRTESVGALLLAVAWIVGTVVQWPAGHALEPEPPLPTLEGDPCDPDRELDPRETGSTICFVGL